MVHRENSFLGTEHHSRAQQQPHPTPPCDTRRALPWECKINQSWHHQLMPPRAIGTGTVSHHGAIPLAHKQASTLCQCPHVPTVPVSPRAQCQCHHESTCRQGGTLDLVPSLGISSCSFPEVWQPQNCHQDPAWPSTTSCSPPNSAPAATNTRSPGQDSEAGTCSQAQHCSWGEAGAPWGCLSSSKRAHQRKTAQEQRSDFRLGPEEEGLGCPCCDAPVLGTFPARDPTAQNS